MTLNVLNKGTGEASIPDEPPPRHRLQFWRSPADQPHWARPALLVVAALAALLYSWNITRSGYAPYYSVAARSMTESWKAFLFTAFDPASTITLDKIGGFLWPQAISARLFGFHAWALTLPQVIEGVVSVLVMYRAVRRWQGPPAGLTAAALLAVTPLAASMFGHAMLDGAVTMCLVLAADQYQKAVMTGRLGPLMLSGVWVGLGFQAKMIYAWIIIPALAVGYLVAAPHRLRQRLGRLLAAGAVLLAVSLSWVALMTLTPESSRPYVDGTTNNSAFAMVFGYNGLDRVHEGLIKGSFAESTAGTGPGGPLSQAPAAGAKSLPGSEGWYKLLGSRFAPQIGWLYPLALLALVLGLMRHRKGPRTDQGRAGYLMWGVWLATSAVVFSSIDVPHTAYVAVLAPALAALSAAGIVALWRTHRAARGGPQAWALPAAIVATEVWTVHVAADYTDFTPWLIPVVIVASLAACSALVYAAAPTSSDRRPLTRRIGVLGLVCAGIAMFVAPTAWSFSVLSPKYAGSAFDASAGPLPALPGAQGGAGTRTRQIGGGGSGPAEPSGSSKDGVQTTLSIAQQELLAYVRQDNGGAKYSFSTDSWETAAPYIFAEALPVLPLGGFMGLSNSTTLAEYRKLVADGALHFAVLSDEAGPGGPSGSGSPGGPTGQGGPSGPNGTSGPSGSNASGGQGGPQVDGSPVAQISNWVRSACTKIDPAAYGAGTQGQQSQETLYRCGAKAG